MRRFAIWTCLGVGLLSGHAMAKDRYRWDYTEANAGILTLRDSSIGNPLYHDLSMACDTNGDLLVEARGLTLWTDVNASAINPADLQILALETSLFRIEAPLEAVNAQYVGWAGARFTKAAAFADGISGSSFLVVRALNRKPMSDRGIKDTDMAVAYPPLVYQKTEPFRNYCKTVASPAS